MKRLLASDIGPIYQLCKAFRDGEVGGRHNPEFSMLEWYQPGFDHHHLMAEVADLVCHCLGSQPVQYFSYRSLFEMHLKIDPFTATVSELESLARSEIEVGFSTSDRDVWLDLMMSHLLEPRLAECDLCFVYDYPASQAALSRIVSQDGVDVGQRFELYVRGMELANGYCELTDQVEQRERFVADNVRRKTQCQPQRALDESLLAALDHGLDACSGVALGIDRLLMLACEKSDIRDVLAFDWSRS
jgi:lysyl-tRNA synthetase class 2